MGWVIKRPSQGAAAEMLPRQQTAVQPMEDSNT